MNDNERIMLECRYIISLKKNYQEIASFLKINEKVVINDVNVKLKEMDHLLYERVQKIINNV